MQQWGAAFFNDDRDIVAHLQQCVFFMRDIHALHEAAHGRHKRVVASPQVPVGDCWLTSALTDFGLEFIEKMAWSADEGCDDFKAGRSDGCDGGKDEEEEEEEVIGQEAHHEKRRSVDDPKIDVIVADIRGP